MQVQYDDWKDVFKDPYFYVDFVSIIPFYTQLISGVQLPDFIKCIRIFRLFKLFRHFEGTVTLYSAASESAAALAVPLFFLFICSITFGVFEYSLLLLLLFLSLLLFLLLPLPLLLLLLLFLLLLLLLLDSLTFPSLGADTTRRSMARGRRVYSGARR